MAIKGDVGKIMFENAGGTEAVTLDKQGLGLYLLIKTLWKQPNKAILLKQISEV